MNITIKYNKTNLQHYETNAILFKIYYAPYFKFILSFALLGIIALIMDFLSNGTIMTSIGLSLLLFAIFCGASLYKAKRNFFNNVQKQSSLILTESAEISIEINEDFVRYQSPILTSEMKWGLFSNYAFQKDTIFILTGLNGTPSNIVIRKTLLTEAQFLDLSNFIKKRLPPINYSNRLP